MAPESQQQPEYHLYVFVRSICSFMARIYMREKGLPTVQHEVNLFAYENLRPEFMRLTPKGTVPVLVIRHGQGDSVATSEEQVVTDSADIVRALRAVGKPLQEEDAELWKWVEEAHTLPFFKVWTLTSMTSEG